MRTLDERFREQVARTPDAIALIDRDERVTFRTLQTRVGQFAGRLRGGGVGCGHVVGIYMRQSTDAIVALLAIAETGAASIGIDQTWPLARTRDLLGDVNPIAVAVDDDERGWALRHDCEIVVVAAKRANVRLPPRIRPLPEAGDDVFSVVYTSGSTGHPKGVLVTRRSLLNKLAWTCSRYPCSSGDVAFMYRSSATVGSPVDCLSALLQGVPTLVSPVDDARDVEAIIDAARRGGVSHCSGSPGFWESVLDGAERHPNGWPTLRLAKSSGEPLPPRLIARFRRVFPGARLLNIYGATECSGATVYDTSSFDVEGATRVPVGQAIPGVEVCVVDSDMHSVRPGERGEVCIAGAALARGYLNHPDLTATRFVSAPPPIVGPLFRTGDIGFLRPDGELEITGRRDLQVKIRGYRVEIEEVEAALRRCPGVRAAAVYGAPEGGHTRLAAFVETGNAASAEDVSGVREALGEVLPGFMIPADIFAVESLPRTANGKIDRAALARFRDTAVLRPATKPDGLLGPTEAAVAAIWIDVLGLADLKPDDDFFDIGGHSLSGLQIVSRLAEALGVTVTLRMLFDHSSIRSLAAAIDREPSARCTAERRVRREAAEPVCPS